MQSRVIALHNRYEIVRYGLSTEGSVPFLGLCLSREETVAIGENRDLGITSKADTTAITTIGTRTKEDLDRKK